MSFPSLGIRADYYAAPCQRRNWKAACKASCVSLVCKHRVTPSSELPSEKV
jgi:hypothetical protein